MYQVCTIPSVLSYRNYSTSMQGSLISTRSGVVLDTKVITRHLLYGWILFPRLFWNSRNGKSYRGSANNQSHLYRGHSKLEFVATYRRFRLYCTSLLARSLSHLPRWFVCVPAHSDSPIIYGSVLSRSVKNGCRFCNRSPLSLFRTSKFIEWGLHYPQIFQIYITGIKDEKESYLEESQELNWQGNTGELLIGLAES